MIWDCVNVDMFMGFDENDVEEDIREEFLCPFCSEYFDIVGLCCHIDEEHPMEAKNGVCMTTFCLFVFSLLLFFSNSWQGFQYWLRDA